MNVYYNEFDPFAAAWLRELIKQGLIPKGDVDDRSIKDVRTEDVKKYDQCHFFAGIGVWSYALAEAGWEEKVWTGSCPCQPFSAAGSRRGTKDERHLWPEWFRLIRECRPHTLFGEQVASKDGLAWLDIVSDDLEREGYAVGAADTSAAGFGAPHRRQRLYFVGHPGQERQLQTQRGRSGKDRKPSQEGRMAYAAGARLEGTERTVISDYMGSPENEGQTISRSAECGSMGRGDKEEIPECKGFWKDHEWLSFRDGKRRPIESGTFPLVDGSPARMGRLRGYGNALCAPQAQGFIEAFMEVANG